MHVNIKYTEHAVKQLLAKANNRNKRGICNFCGSKIEYNEKYDSHFCPKCLYWTEIICPDKNCEYCKNRPKYPKKP